MALKTVVLETGLSMRYSDVACMKSGTGATPPIARPTSLITSLSLRMRMALFTEAISRHFRLETFSQSIWVSLDGFGMIICVNTSLGDFAKSL